MNLSKKYILTDRAVPFVLLAIVTASFGLLIPWLGFYWDDWPVIYMTNTQGVTGFWEFYQYDRPFSAWTYIVFSPIIGSRPLAWHIFTLSLRWLTAVFAWASLKAIWPRNPLQAFWISLLFVVCPIFLLQYVSVAYSQHWICYLLYFASIYLMLKSMEHTRYAFLLLLSSVVLSAVNMLTMEYFLGLELLRPIILWLYIHEHSPNLRKAEMFGRVSKRYWFYGILFVSFVIFRVFFLQLAGSDPNNLVLPAQFIESPFSTFVSFIQMALQDFIYLFTSWISAVVPTDIELRRPFSLAVIMVVMLLGIFVWFVLDRYYKSLTESQQRQPRNPPFIFLGLSAVFLGMLPVWIIGRQASIGMIGSRFALAAMFGVCVLIVGILEWVSPIVKTKAAIIVVLVVLAVHTNLYNAKIFQISWEKQRDFYWQLYWRAPYIQPGTAFISDGEIFPFVGLYSTSMGISLVYPPVDNPQDMPYWFYSYWEGFYRRPDDFFKNTFLEDGLRNYYFSGYIDDSLVLTYTPSAGECLHILSTFDSSNKSIPDAFQKLSRISNLDRISKDYPVNGVMPESIFGSEPKHQWCYYFQKAKLAGQYGDWSEVIDLMETAEQLLYFPSDPHEYLPLLDAYLRQGNVDDAYNYTIQTKDRSDEIDDPMCIVWMRVADEKQSREFDVSYNEIKEYLSCFD